MDMNKEYEEVKKFFNEFKVFSLKKNAIDMALGIILGVSFGKVISSLVDNIITPPIGLILGGVSFSSLKVVLKKAVEENGRVVHSEVSINYGLFLQTIIDFVIVAFTVFLVLKFIDKLIKKKETESVDWSQYIKK